MPETMTLDHGLERGLPGSDVPLFAGSSALTGAGVEALHAEVGMLTSEQRVLFGAPNASFGDSMEAIEYLPPIDLDGIHVATDLNELGRGEGSNRFNKREVTKQSGLDAEDTLRSDTLDPGIMDIIKFHTGDEGLSASTARKAVLANDELRFTLGEYFLQKAHAAVVDGIMPKRVADDSNNKTPGHGGYSSSSMSSSEYSSLLALSMIDGTFSNVSAESDSIDRDDNGEIIRGQHRGAAQILLSRDPEGP